jgi:hypothetical protein
VDPGFLLAQTSDSGIDEGTVDGIDIWERLRSHSDRIGGKGALENEFATHVFDG